MACCGSIETPATRTASKHRMKPSCRTWRLATITPASPIPARACLGRGGDTPAPRDRSMMDAPKRLTPQRHALFGRKQRLGTGMGGNPRMACATPSNDDRGNEPCAPFLWVGEPATNSKLKHSTPKIKGKTALAVPPGGRFALGSSFGRRPRGIIKGRIPVHHRARTRDNPGNERAPPHPYGISFLAPPDPRIDRRRSESTRGA